MSSLSPVKAKKLIKILLRLGFVQIRQKGSHTFFAHKDGLTTVIPVHPTKQIGVGLLRSILNDVQLSRRIQKKCFKYKFTPLSPPAGRGVGTDGIPFAILTS